jgi:hypothetical protein
VLLVQGAPSNANTRTQQVKASAIACAIVAAVEGFVVQSVGVKALLALKLQQLQQVSLSARKGGALVLGALTFMWKCHTPQAGPSPHSYTAPKGCNMNVTQYVLVAARLLATLLAAAVSTGAACHESSH